MRASAHLATLMCAGIYASGAYGDDLPRFDGEDYEVTQVIDDQSALVWSNGRQFLCRLDDDNGYVDVKWCRLFATASEADAEAAAYAEFVARMEVERARARAVSERHIVAEDARQATEARVIERRRQEQEARRAAEEARQWSERDKTAFAPALDALSSEAKNMVIDAARKSQLPGCKLKVVDGKFLYKGTILNLLNRRFPKQVAKSSVVLERARVALSDAMVELIEDGTIELIEQGSAVSLVRCD